MTWHIDASAIRSHPSTYDRARRCIFIFLSCVIALPSLMTRFDASESSSQATLEIVTIDPSSDVRVSKSTTIKATLRYSINGFMQAPHSYTVSLMFDNPMDLSGKSTYFSDFGCRGATQTLTAASGTVTLECQLSQVWPKFRHSKRIGIGFVMTHSTGGPNSRGIARNEGVHYDVER